MSLSVDIKLAFHGFALDVDFTSQGGVTALFGPSGAGKTSIVKAVAGIQTPTSGKISIAGETLFDSETGINIPIRQRALGYVFQEPRLFPNMNVRKNLLFGAKSRGLPSDERHFNEVIDLLGITQLCDRRPYDLSGGEQQRVALGRALLSKPKLLLLDEPLAALDTRRKAEILPYLERLRDQFNIPMLYVSHSVSEIARLATNVALIEHGKLMRFGPVSEVFSDPTAARNLGVQDAGAVLTARVIEQAEDGLTALSVAGSTFHIPQVGQEIDENIRLRIKASDVMLALEPPRQISALNITKGTITHIKDGQGPGVLVQIRCGDDYILARLTRRSAQALALKEGVTVYGIIKSVSVAQTDVGR